MEGNACKRNHKLKEKGIVDGAIMKFPCYNWMTLITEDLFIAKKTHQYHPSKDMWMQ